MTRICRPAARNERGDKRMAKAASAGLSGNPTAASGPGRVGRCADYQLDEGPGGYRIGLLALSSDLVVERDLMDMRPGNDVLIFTNRVDFHRDCDVESLAAMALDLTEAARAIIPGSRLDALIYACTSGTAVIGVERVEAALHAARPEALCVTPITAAQAAFDALGAGRIAVLTPYIEEVAARVARALAERGLPPVATTSFNIAKPGDISAVTPASIHAAALAADCPEAQAMFISCTDFRSLEAVPQIERDLGKPGVTSNQAMFWMALRSAGYKAPITGYGRLLEL